ncbi:dihydrolipoyl dehydrogenase family protein [Spirosoma utsteinense]|uniref:Pyruvate/2-oxoglutarate dehydrogenase complex dihydrolipoamide dehydrogenase (E3) component n=1 Tax=Spirosoma utsteinense TaxID=2585773 RepID=A0ABR6W2Q2_9BACT|nr:NAD(P)/FAD-dependent oxidoreductase [Spirosoma utsteinense]MBC3788124.1 pyruvate/2-oxoglutarate dehydrogenase complex dihydrolipoamide dehydrogenase (E3) component [Spirosoma utsteinense]MBC3790015.1 pyruvate/2-oxoglutarate dehydrogenase complex dihydrolipoamide dehydrogenase (E3) component [Spirosoma utsteinense]
MKSHYDLIAIGAGSAGLGVAIAMKRLGFDVLIVDRTDHRIGGDCLNDGCVPSKALIHVSRLVHSARRVQPFGWKADGKTDLAAVMQYVRERQDVIRTHENATHLRDAEGLDVELGAARFTGRQEIEIAGDDGLIQRVSAKNIVLCTGSKPQTLQAEGIDRVTVYTNENIFTLNELPERLLIVGAGPIGMEMGQAFQRLGSQVTVVGSEDRIMSKELPEVSGLLQKRLTAEGVAFKLGCRVNAFSDANTAEVEHKDGSTEQIPFDVILVAVGRTFHFDDLNLPAAGIDLNDKGQIKLNDYLQTTNGHVFAAGDAAAGSPAGTRYFSHAAELHVSTLINNFITPGKVLDKKLSYDSFSWVTFTDPEVATFGLTEQDLKERKISYERIDYDFGHDDRAIIEGYEYAKLILFTTPDGINPFGTKILGGTMIAPNAGELSQELILAVEQKLTAGAFFNKIYPYPTASRVNKSVWVDHISDNLPGVAKKAVRWLY